MTNKKKSKESVLNLEGSQKNMISYILGLISLVIAFFTPLAGAILGIIGLVQNKKEDTLLSKRAKILNIIAIVIGAVMFGITLIYTIQQGFSQIPTA